MRNPATVGHLPKLRFFACLSNEVTECHCSLYRLYEQRKAESQRGPGVGAATKMPGSLPVSQELATHQMIYLIR